MGIIEQLKDYSRIDPDKVNICINMQKSIWDGNHKIITLNGDDDNRRPTVFKYFQNDYYTQGYVGVISDGENKITIGSRFDSGENQYFLQYVFAKAFDNSGKIFEDMKVSGKSEATWDLLLMIIFVNQLKKAMRRGVFRQYRQFSYNDSNVRGQIDIPRYIKYDVPANGKIAYNTREYTVNNYYNMLFLRAFDKMEKKYPSAVKKLISSEPEVKKVLSILRNDIPAWNTENIRQILSKTDRKIVHNVYRAYEPLRVTSRLILRNMGIDSYSDSRSGIVSGVLIDMTKLWETFLEKTLLSEIGDDSLKAQEIFYILSGNREIKPDFYWENKKIVLDAKYRRAWGDTLSEDGWKNDKVWKNDVRNDVFQVLAYIHSLRCMAGGVIFPYNDKTFDEIKGVYDQKLGTYGMKLENKNRELLKNEPYFFRLPYIIPKDSSNFSEFRQEMEKQEIDLKEKLKDNFNNQ